MLFFVKYGTKVQNFMLKVAIGNTKITYMQSFRMYFR